MLLYNSKRYSILKLDLDDHVDSSVSGAVNADNRSVFDKYPQCFKGIGKLKSFQREIPIDPDVEPVILQMRRIPYRLFLWVECCMVVARFGTCVKVTAREPRTSAEVSATRGRIKVLDLFRI